MQWWTVFVTHVQRMDWSSRSVGDKKRMKVKPVYSQTLIDNLITKLLCQNSNQEMEDLKVKVKLS